MAKFVVAEKVIHYHEVEIDDELDAFDIVSEADEITGNRFTGYEALEHLLEKYKQKFGFEYSVKPNFCGTVSESMEIEDC